MLTIFLLALTVPLAVYTGLIICKSVLLTFFLFHGVICLGFPIYDLLFRQKKSLRLCLDHLGFRNFSKTFKPALLTGLFLCLVIVCFFMLLRDHVIKPDQIQTVLDDWHIDKSQVIPLMLMMIVANSIIEEIFWRGYLYQKLALITSRRNLLLLSAAFYASYHLITTVCLFSLIYGLLFTIVIFGAGIFWADKRRLYNSIYFPLISHLLADLGIMLIYYKYFGR